MSGEGRWRQLDGERVLFCVRRGDQGYCITEGHLFCSIQQTPFGPPTPHQHTHHLYMHDQTPTKGQIKLNMKMFISAVCSDITSTVAHIRVSDLKEPQTLNSNPNWAAQSSASFRKCENLVRRCAVTHIFTKSGLIGFDMSTCMDYYTLGMNWMTLSNEDFNAFNLTFINSCGSLQAYFLNIMSISCIFMLYKRESPNCVIKSISCDIRLKQLHYSILCICKLFNCSCAWRENPSVS